jgi:hypothetical protein
VTDFEARFSIAFCLGALLVACGGNEAGAPGSLTVHASGEEAARSGYPVGEGDDEIAFADGWTLRFSHVIVSLANFTLATADGDDAQLDADPVVADLHLGEPDLWQWSDVPAQRWDRVGFEYVPVSDDARNANGVDTDALNVMIDNGYSLLVRATAEKDGREIELEYGFDFEIAHSHCVSGLDETDGVVVPEGAAAEAQITVHLDHLFFDNYASDEAALRFDPMAAAAPVDGPLALEHLAAQDNLSDLRDASGQPLELAYDPGSAFDPVPQDLRDYVIAAAATTGHFNGEGHCDYEREDL